MFLTASTCTKSLLYFSSCKMSKTGHFTPVFENLPISSLFVLSVLTPFILKTSPWCIFWLQRNLRSSCKIFFLSFWHWSCAQKWAIFFTILPYYSLCKMSKKGHFRHFLKTSHFFKIKSLLKAFFLVHKYTLDHHARCFPIFWRYQSSCAQKSGTLKRSIL